MVASYHMVSPAIWNRAMRALSTEAKLVRLYTLTSPHRLTEGLFALPLFDVVANLELDEDAVLAAFIQLDRAGMMTYDADAEVVLDREALWRTSMNHGTDRHVKGAVAKFQQVPSTPLKEEFRELAQRYAADAFAIALPPDHQATVEPLNGAGTRSRDEYESSSGLETEAVRPGTCSVPSCNAAAAVRDGLDGDLFCADHDDHPFGTAVPIEAAS